MSLFPVYDFSDESLDYSQVQLTVKQMHSYIDDQRYTKGLSLYVKTILSEVNPVLTAMRFNASNDLNNVERWKRNCQFSYNLLYPLTA